MSDLGKSLSEAQVSNLETYLHTRFNELEQLRKHIDDDVRTEIQAYNNVDKLQENDTEEWEERITVPLIYSNVQTAKAKLLSELFAVDNYIRVYVEDNQFRNLQPDINKWVQKEVDKTGLDRLAKDFLEDSLVQRVNWVHLRAIPVSRSKKMKDGSIEKEPGYKVDIQSYKFMDVWFDTRVTDVMKTDFFVRKTMKFWELRQWKEVYNLNQDKIMATTMPTEGSKGQASGDIREDEYESKHSSSGSQRALKEGASGNVNGPNPEMSVHELANKDVEIMEYMGIVDVGGGDMSDPDYVPELKEVIISWVNRSVIVSIQENTLPTIKKRLMFPIRPLRQANSLIGKGIPQITKDQQHLYNRYESLSGQNANNIVKGTFMVDNNSEIDMDEVFLGGGNIIGVDGDPSKAIYPFPHQNVIGILGAKAAQMANQIQNAVGTVDVITGAGGNIPESASGQRSLTEEANFKFMMMGDNVSDDLSDVVKYIIILLINYDHANQYLWNDEIADFLDLDVREIEESDSFDIAFRDLTARRDVEQNQWANLAGILTPLLQQQGADVSLFLSYLLDVFQVPDKDQILKRANPTEIAQRLAADPQVAQQVMGMLEQLQAEGNSSGGGSEQNAASVPGGDSVEQAANENVSGQ